VALVKSRHDSLSGFKLNFLIWSGTATASIYVVMYTRIDMFILIDFPHLKVHTAPILSIANPPQSPPSPLLQGQNFTNLSAAKYSSKDLSCWHSQHLAKQKCP
jgi:hypothetical protein